MVKEFNMIITGVGGQGVVLMSELLGKAAVKDGLRVRGSEILGMAVRGGSVTSNIRLGDDVYGPLIPVGRSDVLIGMEPSEALRSISFLSNQSLVIINTAATIPFTVTLGRSSYPSLDIIRKNLNLVTSNIVEIDAIKIAQDAGSSLTSNIVILGALFGTGKPPIRIETIKETIGSYFHAKAVPVNIKAFDMGYQITHNGSFQ